MAFHKSSSSSNEILKHNSELLPDRDLQVWKERRSLVEEKSTNFDFDWNSELDLVGEELQIKPIGHNNNNHHLIWDYRRWIVDKIGSPAITKELGFTETILSNKLGCRKNHEAAWSHREWIIRKFDTSLWKRELQFCHQILDQHKLFNVSAWNQIYLSARELSHDMDEESRLNEAVYAKKAIAAHPGNEGPWTYLKVLYTQHKEALYANPNFECIFVDVLAEAADRVKLASELDPDNDAAFSSVSNRGCVHALNLVVDLMIEGYEMNKNQRLVSAVKVLYAYPSWRYIRVSPHEVRHMGKGIIWKVCAAMFSVDASRVRYCHMHRGFFWFRDSSIFQGRGPQFEMKALDNKKIDDDDDLSPQLVERLDHLFLGTVFERHQNWKDRLFKTYLNQKQTRPENEITLEEDLKWEIRRCVVKENGTNDAALKELEFTTDIIKLDAYNRRAWLHRQWVFRTFGGEWEDEAEVEFCGELLEKDACNSYAWDQRCFAVTRCVKKIDAAKHPDMDFGNAYFQKVLQLELIFSQKQIDEADYAITKFISVEPENPFPWAHIKGVYSAYPSQLGKNEKVRDAILEVLGNAMECALAFDLVDGIMGDVGQVMVNARGIINALNMLLDLVINYSYNIYKDEKFRDVLTKLCPDSCFENSPNRENDTLDKINFVLEHMMKTLPDFDLGWENAGDQLLGGI